MVTNRGESQVEGSFLARSLKSRRKTGIHVREARCHAACPGTWGWGKARRVWQPRQKEHMGWAEEADKESDV